MEDNILHISDLLGDVVAGKVAGPFRLLPETKRVLVIENDQILHNNPLIFAKRHCTFKEKRRMKKGRRVTDLTGNGLNGQYQPWESSVSSLPSLNFLMCLLNDKNLLISFDYQAAYRNVPYASESWGLVAFVYGGFGFIDLSMTFGYTRAAKIMQS